MTRLVQGFVLMVAILGATSIEVQRERIDACDIPWKKMATGADTIKGVGSRRWKLYMSGWSKEDNANRKEKAYALSQFKEEKGYCEGLNWCFWANEENWKKSEYPMEVNGKKVVFKSECCMPFSPYNKFADTGMILIDESEGYDCEKNVEENRRNAFF
mmetsp:Transcript_29753/g.89563  ORF Transcript_29753/g.89563 Transcript_29753/m.89563 type:complete len:158 (-) Transcript_29753:253-726(-)